MVLEFPGDVTVISQDDSQHKGTYHIYKRMGGYTGQVGVCVQGTDSTLCGVEPLTGFQRTEK